MAETKAESLFSRRVKDLLKEQKITQKTLCNELKIEEGSFSRYMRQGRTPRADIIANIANYLHTTSDYLLGNEEAVDSSLRILASSKDKFTKEQAQQLKDILQGISARLGID